MPIKLIFHRNIFFVSTLSFWCCIHLLSVLLGTFSEDKVKLPPSKSFNLFPGRNKMVMENELFAINRGFCLLLCLYCFLLGCWFFSPTSVCWSLVLIAKVWKLSITFWNLSDLLGFCLLYLRVPDLSRLVIPWSSATITLCIGSSNRSAAKHRNLLAFQHTLQHLLTFPPCIWFGQMSRYILGSHIG